MKARLDGAAQRLRREYNDRAWLAWHVAALTRTDKIPKLESMMLGAERAPRQQTWEEIYAAVQIIHKASGGK